MLTYDHPEAVSRFLKGPNYRLDVDGLERLTKEFLKFPYENISKIIRFNAAKGPEDRLRLPDTIVAENEESGLGGTCFSLTYFFETVLKSLGFGCYPVMVDRSYGENTHCALVVTLNRQKYLVDPGFCLSRPIPLTDEEMKHNLPHNTYIITPIRHPHESAAPAAYAGMTSLRGNDKMYYALATNQLGRTKSRYLLKDTPVSPSDFLKFWEASFNWPMMRQICVTRLGEEGYIYLRNDFLRNVTRFGKKQERIKSSFEGRVEAQFGISAKKVEEARALIKRS